MATNRIDSKKLGCVLKRLIKESTYRTQENFAYEAVFVDPKTVRNWVAGKIDSIETLCVVADALGVDVMAILSECFG